MPGLLRTLTPESDLAGRQFAPLVPSGRAGRLCSGFARDPENGAH
jgi:hypothetical protein